MRDDHFISFLISVAAFIIGLLVGGAVVEDVVMGDSALCHVQLQTQDSVTVLVDKPICRDWIETVRRSETVLRVSDGTLLR